MKRLPLLSSFILFIVLCMSLSFWGMRFYKPKNREMTAPISAPSFEPMAGQWGGLFGVSQVQTAASDYQLKGIVLAGKANESVAIFSANGAPEKTIVAGKELSPGVLLKEVHATYILIGEGATTKRVELPAPSAGSNNNSNGGNQGVNINNSSISNIIAHNAGQPQAPSYDSQNAGQQGGVVAQPYNQSQPQQYRTMSPTNPGIPPSALPSLPPNGNN